jgi:hypothetical protein
LEQNQDSTFFLFRKGNEKFKYVFGVLDTPGHVMEDITKIKINNGTIPLTKGLAALYFETPLPGHDTTDITIIY